MFRKFIVLIKGGREGFIMGTRQGYKGAVLWKVMGNQVD